MEKRDAALSDPPRERRRVILSENRTKILPDMKKFLTVLLLLCLAGTPLFAAFAAKTFEAAKKRDPKDGILVYFYGADWDFRSKEMLKSFWGDAEIKKACGNAAMLAVPVFQNPSEKQQERVREIRRGLKVPHIYSYPAVVMCDEKGRKYYILQGDEILADTKTVAATIREKIDLFRKQKEILQKAERAKGLAKAKLYGEAMLEGIDYPEDALKIIRENDPKGETPYAKRLEFSVFKLITDKTYRDPDKPEAKMISTDEACELVKKLAVDDETTYLPWQRQELLSACVAYLRRTDKTDPRIKAINKKIREIDPDSVWASVADQTEEIWLGKSADGKKKKRRRSSAQKRRSRRRGNAFSSSGNFPRKILRACSRAPRKPSRALRRVP